MHTAQGETIRAKSCICRFFACDRELTHHKYFVAAMFRHGIFLCPFNDYAASHLAQRGLRTARFARRRGSAAEQLSYSWLPWLDSQKKITPAHLGSFL